MKDIKAFVLISTDVIPPKSGWYTVYSSGRFLGKSYYQYPEGWQYKTPTHYLSDIISLSEYMVGFMTWRELNYARFKTGRKEDIFYYLIKDGKKSYPYSINELLEIYLTEKGIIIK